MTDKMEMVRTFAPIAAPVTAAIVETWVKPKLQKLYQYIKTDKALFTNALTTKFDEYLQRAYEKNSYMNIIVFQNQQKKLEEIYIPLTVKQARGEDSILMDDYKEEFIPAYRKVLIRDTAGMGKSTLMKFLFLSCVNNNEGIPIFIELRKLKGDEPILSYIYNELNPIDDQFDKDFILKLIKDGGFIFFLDGYDEIPSGDRDKVTVNLQDFISKAGDNIFILTSRPESSLASFPDFQEFNLRPLEREEAFQLLKNYDAGGELSTEIISKIEGRTLGDVSEFLSNPLLVSLLYKSYEYKRIIPFKKHTFYRQVYDALFETHDLTKGGAFIREKHSGLDTEDFHRVLRAVGFITVRLGQVEYDKDTLLARMAEAKERCPGLVFKESSFLKDLLTTVPLFICEGDSYRWAHKSIQEYFAAQFIWLDAKGKQDVILRQMVQGDRYFKYANVVDLYYEMDPKTFRYSIIYETLCDFVTHYESSYSLIDRGKIKENSIHVRKLITFGRQFIFLTSKTYAHLFRDSVSTASQLKADISHVFSSQEFWPRIASDGLLCLHDYHDVVITFMKDKGFQVFEDAIIPRQYKAIKIKEDMAVNDDPSSPLNQPRLFEVVNSRAVGLEAGYDDANEFLSYAKCNKLKHEIEDEIKREEADDFYIAGI